VGADAPSTTQDNSVEKSALDSSRWKYGLFAVFAGLGTVLLTFWLAIRYYQDAQSVTDSASAVAAVLAPVTTVIGTMVGAYFGLQVGQQSTQQAQAQTQEALKQAADAKQQAADATAAFQEKADQAGKLAALVPREVSGPIMGLTSEDMMRAGPSPASSA
jgi:hypothetical protein